MSNLIFELNLAEKIGKHHFDGVTKKILLIIYLT